MQLNVWALISIIHTITLATQVMWILCKCFLSWLHGCTPNNEELLWTQSNLLIHKTYLWLQFLQKKRNDAHMNMILLRHLKWPCYLTWPITVKIRFYFYSKYLLIILFLDWLSLFLNFFHLIFKSFDCLHTNWKHHNNWAHHYYVDMHNSVINVNNIIMQHLQKLHIVYILQENYTWVK